MTAHRYWRAFVTGFNTSGYSVVSCGRLEFRAAAGGPNVATGGVGIASSTYGGYATPDQAFAGTGNWANNLDNPCWIGYDFGAGNAADIVEMAWSIAAGYASPEQSPSAGKMQYSDDGATWSDAWPFNFGAAWAAGETRLADAPARPTVPGTHRFWRLYADSVNSGVIASAHIEFRETVGGPAISVGGTASASSTYNGTDPTGTPFDITGCFAGTSMWASNTGAPVWMAYDFGPGVFKNVAEVAYQTRTDNYPMQSPNAVHMECSDDGVTWTPYGLPYAFGDASAWSVGETKTFDITLPPPLSVSKLGAYVVEAPTATLFASKLGAYVVEGSGVPLFASKLGKYVVEGSREKLFVSTLAEYVVEGPGGAPPATDHYGQMMVG